MHTIGKIEKVISFISIIFLIQSIIITFRINGNFNSHWSIVFIPFYFLYLVWTIYNIFISVNGYREYGHTHNRVLILYFWVNLIFNLIFTILLSFELTKPGSIGVFETSAPLIILFSLNIIMVVIYHKYASKGNDENINYGSLGYPSVDIQSIQIQKIENDEDDTSKKE